MIVFLWIFRTFMVFEFLEFLFFRTFPQISTIEIRWNTYLKILNIHWLGLGLGFAFFLHKKFSFFPPIFYIKMFHFFTPIFFGFLHQILKTKCVKTVDPYLPVLAFRADPLWFIETKNKLYKSFSKYTVSVLK